jgi:asparagine synthetase B (glutamine-hydrolysing)
MFLMCITRRGVGRRLDRLSVEEAQCGDWVVTAATDGWLSSVARDGARVSVREAAPFEAGIVFAAAEYSAADPSIQIERALIGGRQVYYHFADDGSFYCASHARLLRAAGVRLEDDPARLPELFVYRYISPPNTLFKGIRQVLAGQRLRFERSGDGWRQTRVARYDPPQTGPFPSTAEGAYGSYGPGTCEALQDAMRALSPDKGRIHVLASGGLDSSILYKMARDDLGVADSHSTGYPFETEDQDVEKQYALSAAEALGARHHFFAPTTAQFVRGVLEGVALAEEPLVHTQSVLMMLQMRHGLPPGDATVVCGQGADGAFGLKVHRVVDKVDRFRGKHPRLAPALHPAVWSYIHPLLAFGPISRAMRRGLSLLRRDMGVLDVLHCRWGNGRPFDNPRHVAWSLGSVGDEGWVMRRFGATRDQLFASRAEALSPYFDRDVLDALSMMDFLSDVSVTQSIWSKLGEASRKVVYYPFNAPALLDRAFEAPWRVKLAEPKGVLRDVARRVGLPEFIITRKKANFNCDPSRWALPGGVLEPLVPLAAGVFGEKEVRRMQSPHSRGAYTFWTMLNYAIWKRLFIDGQSVAALMSELSQPEVAEGAADEPALAAGHS